MWSICFPTEKKNTNISFEEKLDEEIKKGNKDPLKSLLDKRLMKCDQELIIKLFPKILRNQYNKNMGFTPDLFPEYFICKDKPNLCYSKFFKYFINSHFLTFNYDGLVEVFLYNMKRWFPHDGYGTEVNTRKGDYSNSNNNEISEKSSNLVIHLHGSLYIITSEFSTDIVSKGQNHITEKLLHKGPKYYFSPYYNAGLFIPYKNYYPKLSNNFAIETRVIAPVRDKTDKLKEPFINEMYKKAIELIKETNLLIAIGYDFNEHDKSSYHELLKHFSMQSDPKMLIISPNYQNIEERLCKDYPNIKRVDIKWKNNKNPLTFKAWVKSGFKGLN